MASVPERRVNPYHPRLMKIGAFVYTIIHHQGSEYDRGVIGESASGGLIIGYFKCHRRCYLYLQGMPDVCKRRQLIDLSRGRSQPGTGGHAVSIV